MSEKAHIPAFGYVGWLRTNNVSNNRLNICLLMGPVTKKPIKKNSIKLSQGLLFRIAKLNSRF